MFKNKVKIALCCSSVLMAASLSVSAQDWIKLPGGEFVMGDVTGDDNEVLVSKKVAAFELMKHEVTNDAFASFVKKTGYITDVERGSRAFVWTKRWGQDPSANFRQPRGEKTSIAGLGLHPVTQVSARDAQAFCMYHGARLPTEVEWEFAARGTDGRRYPWGNTKPDQSRPDHFANYGTDKCCAPTDADGFSFTAPVGSYPLGASPYGVEDMAGNVWEWTSSLFPGNPDEQVIRGGGWGNNNYCLRVSYRHGNPPDIGLDMVGFRCAR